MKLNKKSKELITFITPFGRYLFNRFPMRVKRAKDEFPQTIFENFGNIKNVLSVSNFTIVYGFEDSDHDQALSEILQRSRERYFKFNPDKLVIRTSEILFFGHIEPKDGVKPDPKTMVAIFQMQPGLEDEKQQSSFLGQVDYLNNFLRARSVVFWVGINKDLVTRYPTYQKYQLSTPSESLLQHKTSSYQ